MTVSRRSRAIVAPARLRPPRTTSLVRRDRLVVDLVGRCPVTVVCAPAGSGKTVLVADWATRARDDGSRVAWLSLEEADDRPYEFWSAVLEALESAGTPESAGDVAWLSPPRRGFEPRFVEALRVVLDESPHPWSLVLDDVQRLRNPDVLRGLDVLLAGAGHGLRLVLIGRELPPLAMPRLRVSGLLGGITADDLAFTGSEASEMFDLLDIAVTPVDIEKLLESTEGWAAGLRLAAHTVRGTEDAATRLAHLRGDQEAVSDYLFTEVVQHLPGPVRQFLLDTCAPAQLSVELAAGLSGRPDAGEILEQLCRANALVMRTGEPSWYRYHSLLRSHLLAALARQDADAPVRQHTRAAAWFASTGQPTTALQHAVHSRDDTLTARLVLRFGLRLVMTGQAAAVLDAVGLPGPGVHGDQRFGIIASLAALDAADLARADEWLAVVAGHDWPDDAGLASLRASATVQRSLLGGDVLGDLERTELLSRTLVGDADTDLMLLAYRGPARMRTGDYAGAVVDLQQALALARAQSYDQFVLATLSQLSGMSGSMCDFADTSRWAQEAIEFATPRGWADSPRLAYAYLLASWTAFQTGDVPAQTRYSELGIRALDGVNNVEVEVGVRSMRALAQFEITTGHERRRAAELIHQIWQTSPTDQLSPALISQATLQEVRLLLAVGMTRPAMDAAERTARLLPHSAESLVLRAHVLAAQQQVSEALSAIRTIVDGRAEVHVPTTVVVAHVLAAAIHARRGADIAAYESIRSALDWAVPNDYCRPFLDAWPDIGRILVSQRGRYGDAETFVSGLVDRSPAVRAGAAVGQVLTARQLDVLVDLPTGMTVEEIAEHRGVSPNTVKTHLRGLYQRLGASSRSAAIRVARERGYLG